MLAPRLLSRPNVFGSVDVAGRAHHSAPRPSESVRKPLGSGRRRSRWLLVLLLAAAPAEAAQIVIGPSVADCDEEFENVANRLQPGDELVLRGGVYSQRCRRAITVNGTATQPIVIRGAPGESPILTRPPETMDTQNNIEIVNSSYLIIRGLRFQGGSIGVRFVGTNRNVTLEDCEIFETGANAVALNSGDSDGIVVRRCHIHHTGLSTSGTTEGEGLYVGCNNAACRTTNSVFEYNYIHHLRATSDGGNDGIEVKPGSMGNVIRHNVIHDTNIGRQYPCIFVYGGGSPLNVVEGNVLWNCGEAIQVVADAVIRNNLILSSSLTGITAAPHAQVPQPRNVAIVNNTIYGHPRCLYIRWTGASNMILANNAVYCPGATAVDASGLGGSGVTARANAVEGQLVGASVDGVRFVAGGSASTAFVNPAALDFWPRQGSALLGAAEPSLVPTDDFNGTARRSPFDIGAYETEGASTNPGWKVQPGFKGAGTSSTALPAAPTNLRALP